MTSGGLAAVSSSAFAALYSAFGKYDVVHIHAEGPPEIARAAHLVAFSKKKCGVQDIVVIRQGALKGFVGIHPNWNGINAESIRSLCLNAYLPEEVMKLNDIAEMRAGATLGKALQSEYLTVSGTCFINQSSPVIPLPDLPEQPENVQRPGSEVVEKGMLT